MSSLNGNTPRRSGLIWVTRSEEAHVWNCAQRGVVLNRLVRWTIFTETNRVMREDEDAAEICERCETECATQVIAEREERCNEWDQTTVIRDAIRNRRHCVLAHAVANVAPRLGSGELATTMNVGEVRLREVGAAANQLWKHSTERGDARLADVARWRIATKFVLR